MSERELVLERPRGTGKDRKWARRLQRGTTAQRTRLCDAAAIRRGTGEEPGMSEGLYIADWGKGTQTPSPCPRPPSPLSARMATRSWSYLWETNITPGTENGGRPARSFGSNVQRFGRAMSLT